MADIAMVGDRDSVLLAKAAGLAAYSADKTSVKQILTSLARGGTKVIFVTETLFVEAQDVIEKYKVAAFPAILPVPDGSGAQGIAMAQISANVEKAIGMDILFSEEDG